MYITFEEYIAIYDPIDEAIFNRLAFDACRVLDIRTTGIDNVKKLRRFFPTDDYDVKAVKHCAAKIINLLYQIQQAENAAMEAIGYESTEQGMRGKVISSVSAGNESISYSTGNASATAVSEAVKDPSAKEKLMTKAVWDGLRGVDDANGISLLYMGDYPRGYLC